MRVLEMSGDGEGTVEVGGVRRSVSFQLLGEASVGDYVIVHAGFAIGRVDEAEAALTLEAFAACGEGGDGYSGPGS